MNTKMNRLQQMGAAIVILCVGSLAVSWWQYKHPKERKEQNPALYQKHVSGEPYEPSPRQ